MADRMDIHENRQKPEASPHPDLHKPGDDWSEVLKYLNSLIHSGNSDANQMFGSVTMYDGDKKY